MQMHVSASRQLGAGYAAVALPHHHARAGEGLHHQHSQLREAMHACMQKCTMPASHTHHWTNHALVGGSCCAHSTCNGVALAYTQGSVQGRSYKLMKVLDHPYLRMYICTLMTPCSTHCAWAQHLIPMRGACRRGLHAIEL